jgi:lipopolysaccharide/colanic/teichoic acid biosynthesis glycosyltransferase
MNEDRDSEGGLLSEKRLTKVGRFLRKKFLSYLTRLFSVRKADMSLFVPRLLLVKCLPLYNYSQAQRYDVKLSITG